MRREDEATDTHRGRACEDTGKGHPPTGQGERPQRGILTLAFQLPEMWESKGSVARAAPSAALGDGSASKLTQTFPQRCNETNTCLLRSKPGPGPGLLSRFRPRAPYVHQALEAEADWVSFAFILWSWLYMNSFTVQIFWNRVGQVGAKHKTLLIALFIKEWIRFKISRFLQCIGYLWRQQKWTNLSVCNFLRWKITRNLINLLSSTPLLILTLLQRGFIKSNLFGTWRKWDAYQRWSGVMSAMGFQCGEADKRRLETQLVF